MPETRIRRRRSSTNYEPDGTRRIVPAGCCTNKQFLIFIIFCDIMFTMYSYKFVITTQPKVKISVVRMVLFSYWFACCIMDIVFVWYGVLQEKMPVIRAFLTSSILFIMIMDPLTITEMYWLSSWERVVPWYYDRHYTSHPRDMGDTFKKEYNQLLLMYITYLMFGTIWHYMCLYSVTAVWKNILNEKRSSQDDDDDEKGISYDEEEEDISCRAICQDFCEDKFWCKVKLFGLFVLLLNVLFIAYKFYYLVTTPDDYRAKVSVAELILYPYWFACCLVCILFAQYGIFKEYEWAINMFEMNTLIECSFLDIMLLIELIVVSKHGTKAPWNRFTVGMTVARMFMVTAWSSLMMYLCQSFERGLREKMALTSSQSSAPYMGHDGLSPQVRAPHMRHYSRPDGKTEPLL